MIQIQNFQLSQMRQEEAFTFHQLILTEMEGMGEPISAVRTAYQAAFKKLDDLLKHPASSFVTPLIKQLDDIQDQCYRAMVNTVKISLNHFETLRQRAAQALDRIFRTYGNPTALPYKQQAGVITNLLQDLKGEIMSIRMLDLELWLDQLSEAHEEFLMQIAWRNDEQAKIVTGASRKARAELDEAYRVVARFINSYIVIYEGQTEVRRYELTAQNINEYIRSQRAVLARRKTINAKRNETEE